MYSGVWTALVTPMRDGAVDLDALAELVEWQIECGVDGLVPCGTTGEAATLSPEERSSINRKTVEIARGRVPVVAGTGANSTRVTVDLSKAALEAGVDGLLLVCPYYNKPTQAGLEAHVRTVLAEVDAPVLLYNIPGRTGVDMLPETFLSLAEHPRIVGIKEATGSVERAARLVAGLEGRAGVFAGDDILYLPVLSVGGVGIISASACVAPQEMVAVMRCWLAGDVEGSRAAYQRLLELFEVLFLESNPGPAKAALHDMGRLAPELRLPLVWPAPATVERVRAALVRLGGVES